jgi:hypothetical protein
MPLTPGEWFLAVVNVTGSSAAYSILATEFPADGTNILFSGPAVIGNTLCLTWSSLPGIHYFVQAKRGLNEANWATVSPTITASDVSTTFCIPLPSDFAYFHYPKNCSDASAADHFCAGMHHQCDRASVVGPASCCSVRTLPCAGQLAIRSRSGDFEQWIVPVSGGGSRQTAVGPSASIGSPVAQGYGQFLRRACYQHCVALWHKSLLDPKARRSISDSSSFRD